jgi:flavin reductase (DIM6/NTAB) family NADH-FMN oxidoreductase RutF
MKKVPLPLSKVYGLLEPGPVVLLATAGAARANLMPMSWHMMLEFEPPLVACVVSNRNFSYSLLKRNKECTINIPTDVIAKQVVACGNVSGADTDKFHKFALTPMPASRVGAPLVAECYANLECRVVDTSMLAKYCMFVLEVVQAWIDPAIKNPRTMHHRGYGNFMIAGEAVKLKSHMR